MDYVNNYYHPASRQGQQLMADKGKLASELAAWKARVREAWPGVTLNVQGCVECRCAYDETVELRVEAVLNGLTADDVRVECLVTPECTGTHNGLERNCFLLEKEGDEEGKTVFAAQLRPSYPGLQTLRLRMYPYHNALTHPLEMGAMLWI